MLYYTATTPILLKTVASKKSELTELITHRFALKDIVNAYDVFQNRNKKTLIACERYSIFSI